MNPTMVEDAIPGLHVVLPHLGSHLPQQGRRDVQHGRGSLEHEGDAVDETLSLRVDVVQHQTQTLSIQHGAHRCAGDRQSVRKRPKREKN